MWWNTGPSSEWNLCFPHVENEKCHRTNVLSLHPPLLSSKENCPGSNTTCTSLEIYELVPSTFLHLLFPPGTKLHLRSFLLFYSIRKSGVATHNFTSGRLSIKLYVHSVHCFSLKNLNENIKDAQCSNAIARGDLIHQMADYVFSETKTETKWNPVFRFLKGGGAYVSTK